MSASEAQAGSDSAVAPPRAQKEFPRSSRPAAALGCPASSSCGAAGGSHSGRHTGFQARKLQRRMIKCWALGHLELKEAPRASAMNAQGEHLPTTCWRGPWASREARGLSRLPPTPLHPRPKARLEVRTHGKAGVGRRGRRASGADGAS